MVFGEKYPPRRDYRYNCAYTQENEKKNDMENALGSARQSVDILGN